MQSSIAPSLAATAMRETHVRTRNGRACSCCADLTHGRAVKVRRSQRRRERQALAREVALVLAGGL